MGSEKIVYDWHQPPHLFEGQRRTSQSFLSVDTDKSRLHIQTLFNLLLFSSTLLTFPLLHLSFPQESYAKGIFCFLSCSILSKTSSKMETGMLLFKVWDVTRRIGCECAQLSILTHKKKIMRKFMSLSLMFLWRP